MTTYVFDCSHHFLQQATRFFIAALGIHAIHNLRRVRSQIDKAMSERRFTREKLEEAIRTGNAIVLDLDTQFAAIVEMYGKVVGGSVIENVSAWAENIFKPEGIDRLEVSESNQKPGTTLPKPGGKRGRSASNEFLFSSAQICLASAYEAVKHFLKRAYGKDPTKWPPLIQYFRHVRNGVSHGNRFTIEPRKRKGILLPGIDPSNPPRWRTSVMPDDNTMNGKIVLPDFLAPGDVLILLGDVALQLASDGINP